MMLRLLLLVLLPLADLDLAGRMLATFGNVRPWFRFPFLDEGADEATRDALRAGLRERGLANAYVTVDTWDWALVDLVRQAKAAGRDIDLDTLRALYLEMMLSAVETYAALAAARGKDAAALADPFHDEALLKRLFEERVVTR